MAKGRIVIHQEICKGCEFCAAVCPYHLIQTAAFYNPTGYQPAQLADPDRRCTGCMLCAMICPEAAITVFREVRVRPTLKSESPESQLAQPG